MAFPYDLLQGEPVAAEGRNDRDEANLRTCPIDECPGLSTAATHKKCKLKFCDGFPYHLVQEEPIETEARDDRDEATSGQAQ